MRELHEVDGAAAHREHLCISLPFSNSCKRGLFGIIVSIYQCVPVGLCVCVCIFVGNMHESHHQIYIVKCEMNAFFSTQVHNLFTQSILVRFVWKLEMVKCRLPNAECRTENEKELLHGAAALARFMESQRIADHQEIHDSFYSFPLRSMHALFLLLASLLLADLIFIFFSVARSFFHLVPSRELLRATCCFLFFIHFDFVATL